MKSRSSVLSTVLVATLTAICLNANAQTVKYVDAGATGAANGSSWADAYTSIQTAVASGPAGTGAGALSVQFWIKAGTYTRSAATGQILLKAWQELYGGFAGTETALTQRDWAANVTKIDGSGSTMDGLATAYIKGPGAGTPTLVLDGLTIQNVKSTTKVGAIYTWLTETWNVRHCAFRGNTGKYGSAIGMWTTTMNLENCLFEGNTNTANGGGAIWTRARANTVNIINSTFANNTTTVAAPAAADVFRSASCTLTIKNSIIWSGDGATRDSVTTGGTVSYSDINNISTYTGTGNIKSDPLFTGGGDFTLQAGSPAADVAVNPSASDLTDLAHTSTSWRPQNGSYDMGAYETEAGATTTSTSTTSTSTSSSSSSSTTAPGGTVSLFVKTSPPVAGFVADTTEYYPAVNQNFNEVDPSTFNLYVTNVVASSTLQYRFNNWNDGDVQGPVATTNWAYDVNSGAYGSGPFTLEASFDTYYKLTKTASNGSITNHATTADNFFLGGTVVYLYPNPDSGYVFTSWSGDASGGAVPLIVTMSSAQGITANFKQVFFVDKDATGANNGTSWADAYTTIGGALSAQALAQEFWVADGTYYPPAISTAITLDAGDEIYGGFNGTENARGARNIQLYETIISGDNNSDNVSDMNGTTPLMTSSGANTSFATVDGFTFAYGARTTVAGASYGGAITRESVGAAFNVRNCVFRNNKARYGGAIGIASATASTVENCVFHDNEATGGSYGGAIYVRRGSPLAVMNATFYANTAAGGVANDIFRHVSSTMTIQNSILWSSSPLGADLPTTTYSDVNGGVAGTGNINSDPKFVNAAGRDFRLQSGSPALDTASNSGAPTTDIRGNTRPLNTTADMGAYEMAQFTTIHMTASPNASQTITVGGVSAVMPVINTAVYTAEVGTVELSLTTPQTFGTTRYGFQYWTNVIAAYGFSANPYSYTATAAVTNWQAVFGTQYQTTVTTNPASGAGTAAVADWVNAGATTVFSASAAPGWSFDHWVETTGGSTVSTANPYSPTITCATNLQAVFDCTGSSILIQSSPAGATISVEGTDITTPQTYCYVAASSHSLSAVDVFAEGLTNEFRFSGWSDTQAQSEPTTNWNYNVPGVDATATANYDTYYKLAVTFNTGGTVQTNPAPTDAFHLSGTTVDLTAIPDAGYAFAGWSGDASGTANPLTVTMSKAKSITATFQARLFVDKDAVGGGTGLSWADAYTTLSAALTAGAAGTEFWVAEGNYYPPTTSSSLTLENADAIYGGFAGNESSRSARNPAVNVTVISGDSSGNDGVSDMVGSSPLMTSVANNSAYCEVDGFTFRYGKFTSGAGYGGAISKGNPGAAFRVKHCIFRDNTAVGGGAFGYASNGNGDGTTTRIENSLFFDNTATTAANGGALYARRGGNLEVMNCTFFGNSSGGSVDDVYRNASAALTIQNSILWSSTDPISAGTGTTITYSNVRQPSGTFTGTGNINSNPTFANSANDEYELVIGSGSLDVASATGAPTDDLAFDSRPQDDDGDTVAEYDMGAYEGGVTTTTTTSTTSSTTSTTSSTSTTSTSSTTASLIVPQTLIRFD